jgi:hypothetical protein
VVRLYLTNNHAPAAMEMKTTPPHTAPTTMARSRCESPGAGVGKMYSTLKRLSRGVSPQGGAAVPVCVYVCICIYVRVL